MPLTTAQGMATFLADIITPTEKQQADVTAKRQSTGGYMAEAFPQTSDLPVKRVILIGSAARGTLIRPVDDVDVMAEFINKDHTFEKYRNDSGAFLQRIKTALDAKTAIKGIGARGQAVRLQASAALDDDAPPFGTARASGLRRKVARVWRVWKRQRRPATPITVARPNIERERPRPNVNWAGAASRCRQSAWAAWA